MRTRTSRVLWPKRRGRRRTLEWRTFYDEPPLSQLIKEELQRRDWLQHGFTDDEHWEWWEVGCWRADIAAEMRDAGMTPQDVLEANWTLQRWRTAAELRWFERWRPTGWDNPIGSVCDGERCVTELIDLFRLEISQPDYFEKKREKQTECATH